MVSTYIMNKNIVYAIVHFAPLLTKSSLSFYQIDFAGLFSFSSLDMLRIMQLFIGNKFWLVQIFPPNAKQFPL